MFDQTGNRDIDPADRAIDAARFARELALHQSSDDAPAPMLLDADGFVNIGLAIKDGLSALYPGHNPYLFPILTVDARYENQELDLDLRDLVIPDRTGTVVIVALLAQREQWRQDPSVEDYVLARIGLEMDRLVTSLGVTRPRACIVVRIHEDDDLIASA